jgi:tRNA pseudouridine synthase 10
VSAESLESLSNYFRNRQVVQYTPSRIRRRPVRRRVKLIHELRGRALGGGLVEFLVKCQGGLYVKEFVHGDEGRTQPSIAGTLGMEAIPIELDVLDVDTQ